MAMRQKMIYFMESGRLPPGALAVVLLACSLLGPGCSASIDRPDGGAGDGSGDGWSPSDSDLGDDFGLAIVPALEACAMAPGGLGFSWDVSNLQAVLERKGRVAFRPGLYRLGRTTDSFEVDLIESAWLGPWGEPAAKDGPGRFFRTFLQETERDGVYGYRFEQSFQTSGEPYVFTFRVSFTVVDQVALQPVVILDEESLSNLSIFMTGWVGPVSQDYSTCGYGNFNCSVHQLEFAGGDRLKTEVCSYCPPELICKSDLAGLKRAEFSSGPEIRYVDDYFRLAYAMRHHNWGSDLLVVFDSLGAVHGLYLGNNAQFDTVYYLDGSLSAIEARAVTRYEIKPSW